MMRANGHGSYNFVFFRRYQLDIKHVPYRPLAGTVNHGYYFVAGKFHLFVHPLQFLNGWCQLVCIIKQSIYLTIPSAKPDTMLTREPIVKKEQIACSTKARLARAFPLLRLKLSAEKCASWHLPSATITLFTRARRRRKRPVMMMCLFIPPVLPRLASGAIKWRDNNWPAWVSMSCVSYMVRKSTNISRLSTLAISSQA